MRFKGTMPSLANQCEKCDTLRFWSYFLGSSLEAKHYISTLSIGHNYICTHCLIHMGDIARYKGQVKQAESFYKHSRISSNKTRGYYFFTRPSTAGIIRTLVLIEGWYYYQGLMYSVIKTRKP